MCIDSRDGLYITDYGSNRILYFPSGNTIPTQVYGQNGSFSTGSANNGGVSAKSINSPVGMSINSLGRIYIVDSGNNRVLYY